MGRETISPLTKVFVGQDVEGSVSPTELALLLERTPRGENMLRAHVMPDKGRYSEGVEIALGRGYTPSKDSLRWAGQLVGRITDPGIEYVGDEVTGRIRALPKAPSEEVLELSLHLPITDRRTSATVTIQLGEHEVTLVAHRGPNGEMESGSLGPNGQFVPGNVVFALKILKEAGITFHAVLTENNPNT